MTAFSGVQGKVIRVTPVDSNGMPITDPKHPARTFKGFTRVQSQVQTETVNGISVTDAAGDPCVQTPDRETVTGSTLTIDFCKVDPELLDLVSSSKPVENCDDAVAGMRGKTGAPASDEFFALEIWSDAQAGGDMGSFLYTLFPRIQKGTVGGTLTWENNAQTYTLTAPALDGNGSWQAGPYGVLHPQGHKGPGIDPMSAAAGWGVDATRMPLCDEIEIDDYIYQILTWVRPPAPNETGQAGIPIDIDDLSDDVFGTGAVPANLAAIKADANFGDTASRTADRAAFAVGEYVKLADNSEAYWTGGQWMAGRMTEQDKTPAFDAAHVGAEAHTYADRAALAGGAAGDGTGPGFTFSVGDFIVIGDDSLAHYDAGAWAVGEMRAAP